MESLFYLSYILDQTSEQTLSICDFLQSSSLEPLSLAVNFHFNQVAKNSQDKVRDNKGNIKATHSKPQAINTHKHKHTLECAQDYGASLIDSEMWQAEGHLYREMQMLSWATTAVICDTPFVLKGPRKIEAWVPELLEESKQQRHPGGTKGHQHMWGLRFVN